MELMTVGEFQAALSRSELKKVGKEILIVNDRQHSIVGLIKILEPPKNYTYSKSYKLNGGSEQDGSDTEQERLL